MDNNDHHMDEWYYFESSHPSPPPALSVTQDLTPLEKIAKMRETYNPLMDSKKPRGSWMAV